MNLKNGCVFIAAKLIIWVVPLANTESSRFSRRWLLNSWSSLMWYHALLFFDGYQRFPESASSVFIVDEGCKNFRNDLCHLAHIVLHVLVWLLRTCRLRRRLALIFARVTSSLWNRNAALTVFCPKTETTWECSWHPDSSHFFLFAYMCQYKLMSCGCYISVKGRWEVSMGVYFEEKQR